jgi:hypothetical protein
MQERLLLVYPIFWLAMLVFLSLFVICVYAADLASVARLLATRADLLPNHQIANNTYAKNAPSTVKLMSQ